MSAPTGEREGALRKSVDAARQKAIFLHRLVDAEIKQAVIPSALIEQWLFRIRVLLADLDSALALDATSPAAYCAPCGRALTEEEIMCVDCASDDAPAQPGEGEPSALEELAAVLEGKDALGDRLSAALGVPPAPLSTLVEAAIVAIIGECGFCQRTPSTRTDCMMCEPPSTLALIGGLLGLIDEWRDETEGKRPSPSASCFECTSGTVPNRLNKGPCAEHRARALLERRGKGLSGKGDGR